MSINLKPLGDRLVVEPQQREQTTTSGLVLPETATEKPQQGNVVAVGPGRRDDDGERIPMDVKVGDVVQLKSGGPKMTITSTKANQAGALCTWFDGAEVKTSRFPLEVLEQVKKAKKKATPRRPKRKLPLDDVD